MKRKGEGGNKGEKGKEEKRRAKIGFIANAKGKTTNCPFETSFPFKDLLSVHFNLFYFRGSGCRERNRTYNDFSLGNSTAHQASISEESRT